jgi:endonuclease/exonuclease/phosphatase family metal-dependent hydrolase
VVSSQSPTLAYVYRLGDEERALREHRDSGPGQPIPGRKAGQILVASWNIARLGANRRTENDYELLATMVGWFDLVALQEVRDNLAGVRAVHSRLPKRYRLLFSDTAGNNERMAFLYDSRVVNPLEEIGEIGYTPTELAAIRRTEAGKEFDSFDRTPHLSSFEAGALRFLLVNVHLYFGRGSGGLRRRAAEAFAVAWWAYKRQRDAHSYTNQVLAVGDFNLPKVDPRDSIFKALTAKGLLVPANAATRIGTNLGGTKQFDQVVFLPSVGGLLESGVFDFDNALFQDLGVDERRAVLRYRISDHRILWFVLGTDPTSLTTGPGPASGVRSRLGASAVPWGTLVRPGRWMSDG